ncbi:nuclear transport factor 2 family protein [Allonocardiopsis opalescens]|uniref:SnoaL-like protein n=1 Tax=Allonocardiopsis opalescens TaxID=1144618 RepID=A0A2T0Q3P3_9ACTN|nr:nuclear transport factor 2 family protein [Allonocardiopsis opalescens]PRX98430.1 SnoaL-like protein [Allonocardiopsis opalescens]
MSDDWGPVHGWHRAVNERDTDEARRVAAPGIVLGGPKGTAAGVDVFVEWITRSGIRLVPVAWHPVDGRRVVVEQDATWPGNPAVPPDAPPVRTATLFTVDGGRVAAALRYDEGAEAALRAARDQP